jgi:autotransporter-associated beta strand protein
MKTPQIPSKMNQGRLSHKKLLTTIVALVSVAAVSRADHYYTNNATGDYNVANYWDPNGVPNDNTHNNSGQTVLIQAGDPVWNHGDTLAGSTDGTTGYYIQTGSTNNTGGGNWLRMGLNVTSYGSYVISNGVCNVGGRIQIGEHGTGYLEVSGGTMKANVNDTGANPGLVAADGNFNAISGNSPVGTVVLNSGTLNIGNGEVWFGNGGNDINSRGTGHFIMHGGTFNVNNWFVFGRFGAAGDGYMDGGVINKNNNGNVQIGVGSMNAGATGGQGYFTQMGGTFNCASQYQIATDTSVTVATNDIGGNAILNVDNWFAVGRNGGLGVLNISGNAAITVSGVNGGNLTIGSGGSSQGYINQSGGTITNTATSTYIGESGTATAVWTMDDGAAILGNVYIAYADTPSGVLYLNGGTFRANSISSPTYPTSTTGLFFNGGTLQAGASSSSFLSSLTVAEVDAGGAIIDSQAFNIGIPQALIDGGTGGGLTKQGSGMLTLSGANTYTGDTVINGGTLQTLTPYSTSTGSLTLADNTAFGLTVASMGGQYTAVNLTLGTSGATALNFDLGSFGNPDYSHAPINLSGNLANNGVTTVNVADAVPQLGQFPLITFGTSSGSGSFVLGSVPVGVGAYLSNNVSSIDLVITNVNQPRWDGQAGATWDTGADTNWVNIGTGLPTTYTDPSLVLFDDEAAGSTTVNLTTTVNPLGMTVTNNTLPYSIVGTGKISGSVGINKQGSNSLALLNTGGNDFTGPVTITGGTVSVTNLPNDGVAGPIGKGSLILAGGNFSYSGSVAPVSHSYSITASGSTLTTVSNMTFTGGTFAAVTGAGLNKAGLANLTYALPGSNVLAGASSGGFNVQEGSVTFDGSLGGQTNVIGSILRLNGQTSLAMAVVTNSVIVTGDLGLGDLGNSTNTLTIDGTSTFNMGGWLIFGDGGNAVSTLTLNNGTLNVNSGKILMGGRPFDTSTLNLNGGILNNAGGNSFDVANGGWNSFGGDGSRTAAVNQTGGTNNCNNDLEVGFVTGGTGYYNMTNGQLNVSGLTEFGNSGVGTFNLLNGTVTCVNGLNLGNNSGGLGTLNMSNGTLNVNNWFVVGRHGATNCFLNMSDGTINKNNNGAFIVASGAGDNGLTNVATFNINGGTVNSDGEYWIAENNHSSGTNNISGAASINIHNYVTVGRGGLGVVNMSGGQFNSDSQPFIVGIYGGGTGVWNQVGGALSVNNEIWIGQVDPNAHGTINLDGGTITNTSWLAVGRAGGSGVFNINGGAYVRSGAGGGANGPNVSIANGGGSGVVNVNSGYVDVSAGDNWIGEGSAGMWNQNGGTSINNYVQLARNAGSSGSLSLNNGQFTASEIAGGGGTSAMNFNGGTLIAGANNANFIHDLGVANVQSGGAIIDTASHSVSVNQGLLGGAPDGGLVKNGSGALYLNGVSTYTNVTQVNAGALGGTGTIAGAVNVAAGASLAPGASLGTLTINNALTLASGSSASIAISMDGGATNGMVTGLASVAYDGTLVVTNVGSSPLVAGTQFQLFNAASHTGNFVNAASVSILPAGTGSFDPNTGKLTITSTGVASFNPVKVSGGNLILTGSGGAAPGSAYTLLMSTNVATPLSQWETNTTGVLDGSGMFSNNIPVNTLEKAKFFDVRVP